MRCTHDDSSPLGHQASLLLLLTDQHSSPSHEAGPAHAQLGHLKTVIILAGGFLIFNEAMPPKKLAGVALSLAGIIWCAAFAGLCAARLAPACHACACPMPHLCAPNAQSAAVGTRS